MTNRTKRDSVELYDLHLRSPRLVESVMATPLNPVSLERMSAINIQILNKKPLVSPHPISPCLTTETNIKRALDRSRSTNLNVMNLSKTVRKKIPKYDKTPIPVVAWEQDWNSSDIDVVFRRFESRNKKNCRSSLASQGSILSTHRQKPMKISDVGSTERRNSNVDPYIEETFGVR